MFNLRFNSLNIHVHVELELPPPPAHTEESEGKREGERILIETSEIDRVYLYFKSLFFQI